MAFEINEMTDENMKKLWLIPFAAAALMGVADDEATKRAIASIGQGYLEPADLPDAMQFTPPSPVRGSLSEKRDISASKEALKHHGKARWDLATSDADLFSPKATGVFSCAAGFEISSEATPKLDALLRKTLPTLGLSTSVVKRKYQRKRPFLTNGKPQCTPDFDTLLRQDGSYPSGHAAVGYGWSLILAGLVPERAAQLIARGRAFADSRRYCNVHWLSDTEEGMAIGAAVVARLQANPAFQADLASARQELAQESVKARKPTPDCAAEAMALQSGGLFTG